MGAFVGQAASLAVGISEDDYRVSKDVALERRFCSVFDLFCHCDWIPRCSHVMVHLASQGGIFLFSLFSHCRRTTWRIERDLRLGFGFERPTICHSFEMRIGKMYSRVWIFIYYLELLEGKPGHKHFLDSFSDPPVLDTVQLVITIMRALLNSCECSLGHHLCSFPPSGLHSVRVIVTK